MFVSKAFLRVGVSRKVDSRKRNITQEASSSTFVKTTKAEFADDFTRSGTTNRLKFTGHLQTDFHDFQRIGEGHLGKVNQLIDCGHQVEDDDRYLTSTCTPTSHNLGPQRDRSIGLCQSITNEIIHRQLDSFLRCHTDQLGNQS